MWWYFWGDDFFIFIQNLLDKMHNYAKIRYIIQRKRWTSVWLLMIHF